MGNGVNLKKKSLVSQFRTQCKIKMSALLVNIDLDGSTVRRGAVSNFI